MTAKTLPARFAWQPGDIELITEGAVTARRFDPDDPELSAGFNPDQPRNPVTGEWIEWLGHSTAYIHGHHSAGHEYTLHYGYNKGGGWTVHEGKHTSPKTLGPEVGHGKNAREAKKIAEGHAKGKGAKPGGEKPRPHAPPPPRVKKYESGPYDTKGPELRVSGLSYGYKAYESVHRAEGGPGSDVVILDASDTPVALLTYRRKNPNPKSEPRKGTDRAGYSYELVHPAVKKFSDTHNLDQSPSPVMNPKEAVEDALVRHEVIREAADPAYRPPRPPTEHYDMGKALKGLGKLPGPDTPDAVMSKWFTAKASKVGKAAAEAVYGPSTHRWSGDTGVKQLDHAWGQLGWGGRMDLRPQIALGAAEVIHPDGEPAYMRGIKTYWHEIHHSIGDTLDGSFNDQNDYLTPAGHDIEEGFTELGAWMTMPEFLKAVGAYDRPGPRGETVGQYYQARQNREHFVGHRDEVSYQGEVAMAFDWLEGVESQDAYTQRRADTPEQKFARVKELSMEVNRTAGTAKRDAMVTQLVRAHGIPPAELLKPLPGGRGGQTVGEALGAKLAEAWTTNANGTPLLQMLNEIEKYQKDGVLPATQRKP